MAKHNPELKTKPRIYLGRKAWESHVETYLKSELTQSAYCQKHDLVLTTFHNWVSKIKREKSIGDTSANTFVPVKIVPPALSSPERESGELHICLPNGIECTFPANHAPKLILPWIEYLRVLP